MNRILPVVFLVLLSVAAMSFWSADFSANSYKHEGMHSDQENALEISKGTAESAGIRREARLNGADFQVLNTQDSELEPPPLAVTGEEAPRKIVADEGRSRNIVRQHAELRVEASYSLLLEKLHLSPSQEEKLRTYLVEDFVARTTTPYVKGKPTDEQERSRQIASIIGDVKQGEFSEMETDLFAFSEVQRIESLLVQREIPLSDAQRNDLLEILRETVGQHRTYELPADIDRGSVEQLEFELDRLNDFDRFVVELAPSTLSSTQVQYLFERYQELSYRRAEALERQRAARVDPFQEELPIMYPAYTVE